jgi:hypothetical protein
MATIVISGSELVIEMHGMDQFWALRSQFKVPLANVRRVEARPKDAHVKNMKGALRVGSYIPGYVLAGYYYMSAAGGIGPDAAAVFDGLDHTKRAIEAWPHGEASPRQASHRDNALEHVARAVESMRAAATELGIDPADRGRGWAFYEVHDPEKSIGFDVAGEKIRRVVVEVEDQTPEEAVRLIEEAVRRHHT